MLVYTDSIDYAEKILPQSIGSWSSPSPLTRTDVSLLGENLFEGKTVRELRWEAASSWKYLFAVEFSKRSQYDLLIELARNGNALPDGILCMAGAGDKFHGFRNRAWSAAPGNIHLSAYLAPGKPVEHFGVGFTILAAVSVLEALDSMVGLAGRATIKWVNDILIDDAKLAGVLAYTQTLGDKVTAAVVGIGLNVETKPVVEPTPFVPAVASLRSLTSQPRNCSQRAVFDPLIRALARNYRRFVDGGYRHLLESYRQRSAVIGKEVILCSEDSASGLDVIAEGRVSSLGDNLELHLEGFDKPFSRGRLILKR